MALSEVSGFGEDELAQHADRVAEFLPKFQGLQTMVSAHDWQQLQHRLPTEWVGDVVRHAEVGLNRLVASPSTAAQSLARKLEDSIPERAMLEDRKLFTNPMLQQALFDGVENGPLGRLASEASRASKLTKGFYEQGILADRSILQELDKLRVGAMRAVGICFEIGGWLRTCRCGQLRSPRTQRA